MAPTAGHQLRYMVQTGNGYLDGQLVGQSRTKIQARVLAESEMGLSNLGSVFRYSLKNEAPGAKNEPYF